MKILSFKIESEGSCVVKIFNFSFDYGNEYVGLHNNFILNAHMERVYLTMANCFYLRKPFFMYGLQESGKKETIKTLGNFFGKSTIIFKCSEQFDLKSFNKLLYGCMKSGNWLCLDTLDLVAIEMLSVIAQEIMTIYKYMADPKEESLSISNTDKIALNKNTQIFCMNNINHKAKGISNNIKNYFRLIGLCVPNLQHFVNSSLKNLAIPKVKTFGKKIKFVLEYLNSNVSVLKYKRIGLNLFNKLIKVVEHEIIHNNMSDRITEKTPQCIETVNRMVRKAFERTFVPFLTDTENEDMTRLLNSVFASQQSLFSYSSRINNELSNIIKNYTKDFHFQSDSYNTKLKNILSVIDYKDFYLFVGPPMSGKSYAMEVIKKISIDMNKLNPGENPLMQIVKIFPKAFDSLFLFSENERFSSIQFYNNYFYNMIKLFDEQKLAAMQKTIEEEYSPSAQNTIQRSNTIQDFDTNNEKEAPSIKAIYFDGQIDPSWIDHLNLLHSSEKHNKVHCNPNGDTLYLDDSYKVFFETQNLVYATPTFITRCFIVNFDYPSFSWENLLYNWINNNIKITVNSDLKNYIRGLFENYFPKLMDFITTNKLQSFNFAENFILKNMMNLFDAVLPVYDFEEKKLGKKKNNMAEKIDVVKKSTLSIFIFSCAWTVSFFTNFILKTKIEKLISDIFKADDLKGPIFDYYIDEEKHEFELWNTLIEYSEFYQPPKQLDEGEHFTYNKLFVPNSENIPYQWIAEKYFRKELPIFYSGKPGVGKSMLLNTCLNNISDSNIDYFIIRYLYNLNTTSKKVESFLMDNLSYVKRNVIGDSYNRKVILFIDDCNLQRMDEYKSQSGLEYARNIMNTKYIYDMKTNIVKNLDKVNMLCCANLSNYRKNPSMDRFIHSYNFINQNIMSDESMVSLYKTTFENHVKQFIATTSSITANQYVQATLNLNDALNKEIKPSDKRLHYRFTLRDVSRVFQGIQNYVYKFSNSDYPQYLLKLWFNECSRVYEDRMGSEKDKQFFKHRLMQIHQSTFKPKEPLKYENFMNKDIIFSYNIENNLQTLQQQQMQNNPLQPQISLINNGPMDYLYYTNYNEILENVKAKLEEYYRLHKHKHIILTDETISLMMRVLRVLNFNKGHLIMIGPSLAGKTSITHFTAFCAGRKFYDLDEAYLNKPRDFIFDNLIKKILYEVIYKNQPSVLYLYNKMLERDDILELVNNLINTKEMFTIFPMSSLTLNISEREKELVTAMNLQKDEIIHRIEGNLNIVMCVFPDSVAYKKLFLNFTYLSKHSSVIYLKSWDEDTYLNMVKDNVSEFNLQSSFQKIPTFPELVYEIHDYILKLATQYESKLLCPIQISGKNFTEMIDYYCKNFTMFKDYLNVQKKKYEFAVDVGNKITSVVGKINEELEKIEPQKLENDKVIEERKFELGKKHNQKTQIANAKQEEERPWQVATNQKEDLVQKFRENLMQSVDNINKASASLNRLEKGDLIDFKNVIDNHNLSKFLLSQIYVINGEPSEWDHIKKSLDPKIIKSLLAYDYSNCPATLVKIVRETIQSPDFQPGDQFQKPYKTCGLFCEWFSSMSEYFDEYDNQKPLMDEVVELNKKILEHEKMINYHTEKLKEVSSEISMIERNIAENEKNKQKFVTQIEKRETMKKICEDFHDISKEKLDIWISKRDNVSRTLENIEFYTLFLSCYLNYAPPFNASHRGKIKNFLFMKAESLGLTNLKRVEFYSLFFELNDIKKERDINQVLGSFDDYTKENLLMMYLYKKIPFIIDHNRISKWTITEFLDKREQRKIVITKQNEADFNENIDKSLKEGFYLLIEQCDERVYNLMKNIIKENKFTDKGKTYVTVDHVSKEFNDKFKLFFLKDKIDTKINSKFWIECLVINFSPSREQIKSSLMKELTISDDSILWNSTNKTINEILRDNMKLFDVEDKMHSILSQFDYTGNVEKNQNNSSLLEKLKNEIMMHNNLQKNVIEVNKDRLFKNQSEISKFSDLAADAAHIYKLLSKFIYLDNIYNFSFVVYSKYIKEYYRDVIKIEGVKDPEYTKDKLITLIRYIFDKVALLFSFEERKLLLSVLVFFYLYQSGEIPKNYKNILTNLKNIYFDKGLDTDMYNQESPLVNLSKFKWNALRELNDKSGFIFSILMDGLENSAVKEFDEFLNPEHDHSSHLSKLSEYRKQFTFPNEELDQNCNLFIKFIFFTIAKPYKFQQLIRFISGSLFGADFIIPKLNLQKAILTTPNRKVLLIIDNEGLCEKEIITTYMKKYTHDSNQQIKIINLQNELIPAQMEQIIFAMKNGNLIILRNVHLARVSTGKIFEMLNDFKTQVHEAFRIIFITKSNLILSNSLYDNCMILNRNIHIKNNIKDYMADLLDNVDITFFDYLLNRKHNNLQGRKLFFHLIIVHSLLKQYHFYNNGIYNTPIEFNKKDFFNCFYFISKYLENLGEHQENVNNNPHNNFHNNNYFSLMNVVFESFYLNRLVYKEETPRVMKILQKYFEEDRFGDSKTLFNFKFKKEGQGFVNFEIPNIHQQLMTVEDVVKTLDNIPLENYYELLYNLNPEVVEKKLEEIPRNFFNQMTKTQAIRDFQNPFGDGEALKALHDPNNIEEYHAKHRHHIDLEKFEPELQNLKSQLPELLNLVDEVPSTTFKLTNSVIM